MRLKKCDLEIENYKYFDQLLSTLQNLLISNENINREFSIYNLIVNFKY